MNITVNTQYVSNDSTYDVYNWGFLYNSWLKYGEKYNRSYIIGLITIYESHVYNINHFIIYFYKTNNTITDIHNRIYFICG